MLIVKYYLQHSVMLANMIAKIELTVLPSRITIATTIVLRTITTIVLRQ